MDNALPKNQGPGAEAGPEAGKPEGASLPAASPVPPFDANPTPAQAATEASQSNPPQADQMAGPPPTTSPNVASSPSGSVSTLNISSSAPRVVPAQTRGEGRAEGGIVRAEGEGEGEQQAEAAPRDPAGALAGMIREQLDILTQRAFFEIQEYMRPSALATDPITLRVILTTMAEGIERGDHATFLHTFMRTNLTLPPQINDQVVPYHSGIIVSTMIEGILRDAITHAFTEDPALRDQMIALLDGMTDPGYRELLRQPAYLSKPLAPRV